MKGNLGNAMSGDNSKAGRKVQRQGGRCRGGVRRAKQWSACCSPHMDCRGKCELGPLGAQSVRHCHHNKNQTQL